MAILEEASRSFQRWAEWAEHGRLKANCQRQEEEEEKNDAVYFCSFHHALPFNSGKNHKRSFFDHHLRTKL
jgi:hypothetical protein